MPTSGADNLGRKIASQLVLAIAAQRGSLRFLMEWIEMALCASASIQKTELQNKAKSTGGEDREHNGNESSPSQDAKITEGLGLSAQSGLFSPVVDMGSPRSGMNYEEDYYFDTYSEFTTSMMAPPGKISYEVFIEIVKQMKKTAVRP